MNRLSYSPFQPHSKIIWCQMAKPLMLSVYSKPGEPSNDIKAMVHWKNRTL